MEPEPSDGVVSKLRYLYFVKASWILIDIIVRHPQYNLLRPSLRYDIEILTQVSKVATGMSQSRLRLKEL